MKGCSKNTKIITTLVILTLLFLCAVNVTFSYFSATAKVTSSISLPEFSFSCAYETGNVSKTVDTTQLEIYPATAQIKRGTVFTLKVLDDNSSLIYVTGVGCLASGTRDAYVRFWIDAYLVDDDGVLDTSVNYGEYFLAGYIEDSSFGEVQDIYAQYYTKENNTYFLIDPVSSSYVDCFKYVQLSASAPAEMLGETLRVFVTLQGVQIENQAYKSVFDDERGYCSDWGI